MEKNPLPKEQEQNRKLDEVMKKHTNSSTDPVNTPKPVGINHAVLQPSSSFNGTLSQHRLLPSTTGWLVFFLVLGIAVIAFLDWQGYLPLSKNFSNPKTPSLTTTKLEETERAYVLIANRQDKLYYFDQQRQGIVEIPLPSATTDRATGTAAISTPVTPIPRGAAKMIPTINKLVPSPDREKVALIANDDKYRSHILVLDFAKLENQAEFLTRWTEKLPPGYSVRAHDIAAWSPDNQALAFVASKEDQPDLFVATSKDQVQRMTYHGKRIGSVLWLDSQRLAFVANLEGQDQMYIVHRSWGVKELSQ